MAKKKDQPTTSTGNRKELIDLLRANAHRHDLWRVFSDFVEMAAIAISNTMDIPHRPSREGRYLEMARAYSPDEMQRFAQAVGALTMALELSEFDDLLGSVFMELELGSKWHGQFFTPYHLCHLMGQLTLGDQEPQQAINDRGYVMISDPCVGGGAMLIGMAHAMKERGINFQRYLYAVGQDLDLKAVHMAYVQLSLLGIPAQVVHGNSLANEIRSTWYTPMHFMGGWEFKLRRSRADQPGRVDLLPKAAAVPAPRALIDQDQFSLFEEAHG